MDRVFVLRFWSEPDSSGRGFGAEHWRVRIRYVNQRKEYHVDGVDNAFALIRTLLRESNGNLQELAP